MSSSKRDKSLGRPSTHFRIPSADSLCKRLGIQSSASDPLTLEDLQSARKTRQAAHRELIRRRPGLYLRQWLADRLGVSGPTIWRYTEAMEELHVTPTFTATSISWGNLNAIPTQEACTRGILLEDSTGQRWPALKGIATKLLGQGRGVKLLVQSLSYYWSGHGDPPALGFQVERAVNRTPNPVREPLLTLGQRIERLVRHIQPVSAEAKAPIPRPHFEAEKPSMEQPICQSEYAKPAKKRRRHYWRPLDKADEEALAQKIYTTLNARIQEPKHKLSLASARKLVDRYGPPLVSQGLQTLDRRANVQQPVGWLSTWLRSQNRSLR